MSGVLYGFYLQSLTDVFTDFQGNSINIEAQDMPCTYTNTYIDWCEFNDCVWLIVEVPESDPAPTAIINNIPKTAEGLGGIHPGGRPPHK